MRRVLFVDNEPETLRVLAGRLPGLRGEWDMIFLASALKALETMAQQPVDAVVSGLLLPDMNGAQFLAEVKNRHPQTVRIVFSGDSDRESLLRLLCPAHQCLLRSSPAAFLRDAVARALDLRDMLNDERLQQLVARIQSLPGLPSLYVELLNEASRDDASIERMGGIISRDIAMTAKILQVVNSAFFGAAQPIAHPAEAAMRLGTETLRSLVLCLQVFSQFPQQAAGGCSIETLWKHSWKVGQLAKKIATAERMDPETVDQCFTAGLLHDVGKLILASNLPEPYGRLAVAVQQRRLPAWAVEREQLGTTHAEVGASLLGLWGLHTPVVEAVALHHRPERCVAAGIPPATIIHVANSLEHEAASNDPQNPECIMSGNHLVRLGIQGHIEQWRQILAQQQEE